MISEGRFDTLFSNKDVFQEDRTKLPVKTIQMINVIKSDIFLIISGCFIFEEFLISCDQGIITGGYFRFRG